MKQTLIAALIAIAVLLPLVLTKHRFSPHPQANVPSYQMHAFYNVTNNTILLFWTNPPPSHEHVSIQVISVVTTAIKP